jgi:nitrogenase iron protein NifH
MQPTASKRRHLVVCGKGGIGKTAIATNLAEALNEVGQRVMIVGCSPKSSLIDIYDLSDSMSPILDLKRKQGITAQNIGRTVGRTPRGILLFETGGPEPGVGCAGVGLPTAFQELQKYKQQIDGFEQVDYAFYDLIGDVVCGGFSTPMRGGGREVIVILSGELMAVYAGNNILRAVKALGGDLRVAGYVLNMRGVPYEQEVAAAFAERTQVPILASIPRDSATFKHAERQCGTVVGTLPDSSIAATFRELARRLHAAPSAIIPKPVDRYDELYDLYMGVQQDRIEVHDNGPEQYQRSVPREAISRETPKRISIYGTGGIGKSTTSANVSAALVLMGEKVFQIGCDPKHDSIANLCGELKPTILDELQKRGGTRAVGREPLKSLIFSGVGYDGRLYGTECGGPVPGKGCAGKGVELAIKLLEEHRLIEEYHFTFIIYDVLGDTVCGGFARPLKFTPQAYIVTSGEVATMTQAMKIAQSIRAASEHGMDVGIGGIIDNMRGIPHEAEIVEAVFGAVGLPVIHHIPRSEWVQKAENLRTTVVQTFMDSDQAREYMELARKLRENAARHSLTREILSTREILAIVTRYA